MSEKSTDNLTLEELIGTVGEENIDHERAATRLEQLDKLSVSTLERGLKRGNQQSAIYVHRTLHHRTGDNTIRLPGFDKAKSVSERAEIVFKALSKRKLSPNQAKILLGLSESVELASEIEKLRAKIQELESGRDDEPEAIVER